MIKLITKVTAALVFVSLALFGSANAKTLKFETHFSAAQPSGEVATQLAKNVEKFSGGSIKVQLFHGASVTGKSAEVWNSARNGIIDCDFTVVLIKLVKMQLSNLLVTLWEDTRIHINNMVS